MSGRTLALTGTALSFFAANSLLCRAALGPRLVDAATFTTVRLATGALALALVAGSRGRPGGTGPRAGSWTAAAALFVYAAAFSLAYLRIPAGVGALVLFASVQATMIGQGLLRGERPRRAEWTGLLISLAGLVALTLPGLTAPDRLGSLLMAAAGVAWGLYSLQGRGAADPVAANAGNFARSVPIALALSLLTLAGTRAVPAGLVLAAASGALASGVGYAVWYAALRDLSATRAAIVQLAVPPLAAAGGVALLGEALTPRLIGSAVAILGGIALAVTAHGEGPSRPRPRAPDPPSSPST